MRTLTFASAAALVLLGSLAPLALGCDGDVSEGSGGSGGVGGTTTTTTTTTTGGGNSGDCDTGADCPGSECVEITPGGFRVCRVDPVPATSCQEPNLDECCSSAECDVGECLTQPIVPYCGGPQPAIYNVCAADQCAGDLDCGEGAICAPAGTLGRQVAACAAASCKLDTDCAAEPGGICAPVDDYCCGSPTGLFCVYPSDGCRTSSECPSGQYCEISPEGRTHCVDGVPACPA
ncbi:MAG: hypothetical protein IT372_24235 [Polyangiaceae bacterium]|nr:hypothetical protein [Polyangiaceae bacterium]